MILQNKQKFTLSLIDIYEQNWKNKWFWTYVIYIFYTFSRNWYAIIMVFCQNWSWLIFHEFVVVFLECLFWINILDHVFRSSLCFDLSFFQLKFSHFVCELLERFWKVWTILFRLLVEHVLPFTTVLIPCLTSNMSNKEELIKLRGSYLGV